jgi:hypothetical protein
MPGRPQPEALAKALRRALPDRFTEWGLAAAVTSVEVGEHGWPLVVRVSHPDLDRPLEVRLDEEPLEQNSTAARVDSMSTVVCALTQEELSGRGA